MTASADVDLAPLWRPLDVGATRIKNRVMTTAHSLAYGRDHVLSDRHVEYYRERARGGVGLLISEQHAAHPLSKGSFHHCLTAWEERSVPEMAKVANAVHEHDCRFFVELFTTGVQDKGWLFQPWHELWAPSRIPSVVHNELPFVMEQAQIDSLLAGYARAAGPVQDSGLDGVELHGAHSYGIAQFLSPYYNRRDDRYGGSVRARCRFAIEVAESIRARVGTRFTMGLRLSFDEFAGPSGITGAQTEEQLDILAATGLFDFFDISGGNYQNLHMAVPTMAVNEGYMVDFGRRAKAVVGDRAAIFVVGRIRELPLAAEVIRSGAADMVAMTRAHIADPHLVRKALDGRRTETTRCVGANECILRNFQQRDIACLVNPVAGREEEWAELVAVGPSEARRVVVVGAGPAGLRAAVAAARRGHKVTLVERHAEPGGHVRLLAPLPTRGEWRTLIEDLVQEAERLGVRMLLGTEATAAMLGNEGPDVIVCATGAHWDRTGCSASRSDRYALPGVQQSHVRTVDDAVWAERAAPGSLGARVVIVDDTGEYLPLGLAELLAQGGAHVRVVSPRQVVGEQVFGALEAPHLLPRLAALGVVLSAQTFVEQIDGHKVELYGVWGGAREVEHYDAVVLSLWRTPDDALYRAVRSSGPEIHLIGDALAPRRTIVAVYEGERVGRAI